MEAHHKKIFVPLYGFSIHVVVAETVEEAEAEVSGLEVPWESGGKASCYFHSKEKWVVIHFKVPPEQVLPGLVAHEALHTMMEIKRHLGWEKFHPEDEPEAYLLEWLVDEIYAIVHKQIL